MRSWRFGALAAVFSTLLLGVTVPAQAEIGPAANPETVTGLPLATWQTNGTVMDIKILNNVAYVAGNFTKVRPPGAAVGASTEVVRNRLAAFDATTGALLSWAPSATAPLYTVPAGQTPDKNCTTVDSTHIECATVWSIAVTPDQKSIVVGGDFTAINGQVRASVAAFTAATGALDPTFKPSVSGRVQSVTASNTGVWVGGGLFKAGGQTRTGLAAFDFPAGTVRPFNPAVVRSKNTKITTGVNSIKLTADGSRLVVGGGFDSIAGRAQHGLTALDPQTGAPVTWNSNRIVVAAAVTSVNVIGDRVYSTADADGSESEGVIGFDAATGTDLWYDSCRGASHSMAIVRGVVYAGSHSHDCGAMEGAYPEQYQNYGTDDRRRYTLRAEVPTGVGARYLPWSPRTNDGNGANAMATDDNTLWIGGEFTSVDNGNQQGLTRFSFLDKGAQNHKPLTPQAPVVTSTRPGIIDVSFKETEDPDNRALVYQLIKDHDTANPVYQVTSSNAPWRQGWFHYTDDVADGSSHTYDVRATDPLGLSSNRSTGVTISAATSVTALADLAKKDQAALQLSFETRVNSKYGRRRRADDRHARDGRDDGPRHRGLGQRHRAERGDQRRRRAQRAAVLAARVQHRDAVQDDDHPRRDADLLRQQLQPDVVLGHRHRCALDGQHGPAELRPAPRQGAHQRQPVGAPVGLAVLGRHHGLVQRRHVAPRGRDLRRGRRLADLRRRHARGRGRDHDVVALDQRLPPPRR